MNIRVVSQVRRGFWSGLLGGALAAIIIGWGNYPYQPAGCAVREMIPQSMLYALIVGIVSGVCNNLGTAVFRGLRIAGHRTRWFFNEVMGGLFAGLIGGIFVGLLGGLWFGVKRCNFIEPSILLAAAGTGTLFLSMALVISQSAGDWSRVVLSCLAAASLTSPLYIACTNLILRLGMVYFVNSSNVAAGGLTFGMIVGALMGAQLGCALAVYRYWNERAERHRSKEIAAR